MIISLEQIKFHSPLGWYDEEQILGSDITVDIEVEISKAKHHDNLSETINYESLYEIISSVVKKPAKLIETYAEEITANVFSKHSPLHVKVKVCKLNPPLSGEVKAACISLEKSLT